MCAQQQGFEYSEIYKTGASSVSGWTKSHVPKRFVQKGDKEKIFCQSRLFSQQSFVWSWNQPLNFTDLKTGCRGNWIF